jgi:hypothetical protein
MKHIFSALLFLMILLNTGFLHAQSPRPQVQYDGKKSPSLIEDLISSEVVGVHYRDQWKYRGGGNVDNVNLKYTFSRVSRFNEYGLLLEVNLNEPKRGEQLRRRILDAVRLRSLPVDNRNFSDYCKSRETSSYILAEVQFKKCQLVAVNVYRAWRVDSINWKFVSIDPKKVVCQQVAMGSDAEEGQVCPELGIH